MELNAQAGGAAGQGLGGEFVWLEQVTMRVVLPNGTDGEETGFISEYNTACFVRKGIKQTLQGAIHIPIFYQVSNDPQEQEVLVPYDVQPAVILKSYRKEWVLNGVNRYGNTTHEDGRNEIAILRTISEQAPHRNVARALAFYEDPRNWIVEMERGRYSLMDYLAILRGDDAQKIVIFNPIQQQRFILDMAMGVAHLHSHGICHLDISLENAILFPDGTVKLIDFGMARSQESTNVEYPFDSEGNRLFIGKIPYMPPELARPPIVNGLPATHFNGLASDIWQLGISFYIILTGCQLYADIQATGFASLVSRGLAMALQTSHTHTALQLTPSLVNFLHPMLTRNPLQRPTADAVLQEARRI